MSFPDRQTVLDFLARNPQLNRKQDIARHLKVKGRERQTLREILNQLEAEGVLTRTSKRAWSSPDTPPPTSVIEFHHVDETGELIARAVGKKGLFGPPLIYAGYANPFRGRAPGLGDRGLARLSQDAEQVWSARLMKLFAPRSESKPLIGLLERTARGARVQAAHRKDKREVQIAEADLGQATQGDLVKVMPLAGHAYGLPRGRVVEVIGTATDPRAASLLALATHEIPTQFPDNVLQQARTASPPEISREDLQHLPLITIDPSDARDHDDAVYAEPLGTGWRIIVAIADVSAYVPAESALDKEARKRGNSTYFPDRVVPMLPFELSADACSLKQDEARPCLAVIMDFDQNGVKTAHRFTRALMRSAASLSYQEAQQAIDGYPTDKTAALLDPVLIPLWQAYRALQRAREKRQPLELDLPERRISFTDEGKIEGIRTKERYDAHKLIEEFMIQANVAAAETLEQASTPCLYRIHDAPSDAKIAALSDFLKTYDYKWPKGEKAQTARFNRLLAEFETSQDAPAISELVLRSQSQAIYSPDNSGHFGLNLTRYTHFTSPIRRYSDLIIHRALIRVLSIGPDGLTEADMARLDETADHLTMTERRSMAAERDATDRYLALFLSDQVGAHFSGRISGASSAGLFVRLLETGADGFVPARTLEAEYWIYNESAQAMIAERSGRRFEIGMEVTVALSEVTPLQGGLILKILSRPKARKPGESLPARRQAGPSRAGSRGKSKRDLKRGGHAGKRSKKKRN